MHKVTCGWESYQSGGSHSHKWPRSSSLMTNNALAVCCILRSEHGYGLSANISQCSAPPPKNMRCTQTLCGTALVINIAPSEQFSCIQSFPNQKRLKKKKKERDSDLQTVLSHGCALFRVPWGQAISYQGKKENIHWETCHTNT